MTLYISDLDGTLLDSSQRLDAKVETGLNELIGSGRLDFTVATARSLASAWPIIGGLGFRLPLIFHNGAVVHDPVTGTNIRETVLDEDAAGMALETALSFGLHPILYRYDPAGGNKIHYTGMHNKGERDYLQKRLEAKDPRFALREAGDGYPRGPAFLLVLIEEKERLDPAYLHFSQDPRLHCHYTQDIYSKYQWLELSHPEANKRSAAEFLRARLGADRIVAFGDNLNDLPLLEAADEFYAVRNAVPELIARSSGVIGANDEGGVLGFLRSRLSP